MHWRGSQCGLAYYTETALLREKQRRSARIDALCPPAHDALFSPAMAALRHIPLFPLGLVLYPAERLPLHIFEPRYREMIAECLETESPFGVLLFDDGELARVGCLAHVADIVQRYEDGRMDLVALGGDRFEVVELDDSRDFLQGSVSVFKDAEPDFDFTLRERVIAQHMRLLELAGRTVRPSLYETKASLAFALAHNAGLVPEQKQAVLEARSENERLRLLADHMEQLIPRVEQVEELRRKVQSNGHFRDFPPEDLP
jgi:ATP-dependent Lon protease